MTVDLRETLFDYIGDRLMVLEVKAKMAERKNHLGEEHELQIRAQELRHLLSFITKELQE